MWDYVRLEWRAGTQTYYPEMSYPETWKLDTEGDAREWHDMLEALRDLGKEGWEAVSVVMLPSAVIGSPWLQYVLLKRQVR